MKVRVWDKKDKIMFPFDTITSIDLYGGFVELGEEEVGEYTEGLWDKCIDFEDCLFLRSTGLKDKNGVKIYEGDIVKNKHPLDGRKFINGEIEWDKTSASFGINYVDFECMLYIDTDREVVGNIYENKELLDIRRKNNDL